MRALALYTDAIIYLDDVSEDNTVELVENIAVECNIIQIIKKKVWIRNECQDRMTILEAGRAQGGTHLYSLMQMK